MRSSCRGLDGDTSRTEVWAGLTNVAAGDTMDLQIMKRLRSTGAETAVTPIVATTVAPANIVLTPAAEWVLDPDYELFLRVRATDGAVGTRPGFVVRGLRHQERIYELR